jgi:hypothetical protein
MLIEACNRSRRDRSSQAVDLAKEAGRKYISVASLVLAGES